MTSTPTTTPTGIRPVSSPEEGPMFNSPTVAEVEARAFAAQYPTANVLHAVELAEAGRLGWGPVRDLFKRSLGEAIVEVSA